MQQSNLNFTEKEHNGTITEEHADVAQLVEQLIRNQQVIGSSPIVGSIVNPANKYIYMPLDLSRLRGLLCFGGRKSRQTQVAPEFVKPGAKRVHPNTHGHRIWGSCA